VTVVTERREGGVTVVTMNRPDRLNALNPEMIADLHDAFAEVEADRDCRVAILTGAGRGFCAGADLKSAPDDVTPTDGGRVGFVYRIQENLSRLILRMHDLPQPIVAAVNGVAVGGGLALALASDVRVAAETARFGAVFIKVGLTGCDVGVSYFLPRVVGAGRARELMLTGRIFDTAEADRIGLVTRVVPEGGAVGAAGEIAREIIAHSEFGVRFTKTGLNTNIDAPSLRHAIELENRQQVLGVMTDNMTEAARAFQEGRAPRFEPF
jgi:enoyl-CoA hydratase